MPYNWQQHVDRNATIEGRAVEGGGGSAAAAAVQKTLHPKGFVKLNTGITYIIDSLQYFDDTDRFYLYDLLIWTLELDEEYPFLTAYNRKEIRSVPAVAQRNSEAAAVDLEEDEL